METVQSTSLNLLERFNRWIQDSVMVKLFSIGFLILILLIPTSWIDDLINERQQRAEEVMSEVSDKWSGSQIVSGPMLVVPFKKIITIDKGKDGKETSEYVEKAYFLPEKLDIEGIVKPQVLHRGIFDAVVYESVLGVNASFVKPDFKSLSVNDDMVLWRDAYMVFGISDVRGISDNPVFKAGDDMLNLEPSNNIGVSVSKTIKRQPNDYAYEPLSVTSTNGVIAKLPWSTADDFKSSVKFDLSLKGSKRLDFIPVGKTTSVKISGEWNNPSFDGAFLPESRELTDKGFSSLWKVLHFNRPFSQQWIGSGQELAGADFGVKLLIPVDQYQKSTRTSKYGILIILLTFMALFLVEIIQKIRIHPFQYILIGVALIIYYTLLLSFSEHIGYDMAYIISSIATVALISLYSTTFFRNTKLVVLFTALLVLFYTFIYVIILQQDFSLLLGSIGLFLIIGSLMYFSRKVSWYGERVESTKV
jgi:inner membrane protein